MDTKIQEYKDYLNEMKQKKVVSKLKLLQQIRHNINDTRKFQQKMKDIDLQTNHLVNPVEYQMMEENQNKRALISRQKKSKDDKANK